MCTQQGMACPWCGDTMAQHGTGLVEQHAQPPSEDLCPNCTDSRCVPEPMLPCQHPSPTDACCSEPFVPTPRPVQLMPPGRLQADGVPYILMEGPLTPRRVVPPLQLMGIPSGQPIHQRTQQPIQQPAQPTMMQAMQQQFMPSPTGLGFCRCGVPGQVPAQVQGPAPVVETGDPRFRVQNRSGVSPFPEGRREAISQPGSLHATLVVARESCGGSASCGSGDAPNPRGSSGARPPDDARLIKSLVNELMAATDRVRAAADQMAPPPNPPSGHPSSDAELATYVRERLNRMTGARRTAAVQEIRAVLDDIGGQHAESG